MTAELDGNPRTLARAALLGAATLVLAAAVGFTRLSDGSPIPWWRRYDAGSWVAFLGTFGFVVPFAVVAIPVESVLRTDDRPRPTRLEWLALAVGVGHLLAVDRLKTTLEHRPLLPPPTELAGVDPYGLALLVTFTVGLILLGAVPVVLAGRLRLLTPPAAVLVAFGWASYRTWLRSLETLPPAGPGFGISPTPLTLYAWGASVLLVGVLVLAGLEFLIRRTLGIAPPPSLVGEDGGDERH